MMEPLLDAARITCGMCIFNAAALENGDLMDVGVLLPRSKYQIAFYPAGA
jgi:hypothetical protein